jgi:hypothetical protein
VILQGRWFFQKGKNRAADLVKLFGGRNSDTHRVGLARGHPVCYLLGLSGD